MIFGIVVEILDFYFVYIDTNIISNSLRLFGNISNTFWIAIILLSNNDLRYKLSWTIIIIFIPIFGGFIYFLLGSYKMSKKEKKIIDKIKVNNKNYIKQDYDILENIKDLDKQKNFNYIYNMSDYTLYKNSGVKYFAEGEVFFNDLISELEKAKEYIFLNYHIISKGDLLDRVLNILYKKAKENEKIIIIFDSLASRTKIPKKFIESLKKHNIEVLEFNKNIFNLPKYLTLRDHKKIAIIDGKAAYCGGANIADEYINVDEKYGYFKDSGIKIYGEAISSYIVIFGRFYEMIKKENFDYYKYIKHIERKKEKIGYVLNIESYPNDSKDLIQNMYINFINSAKEYVYITTPYLMLSESLLVSLKNASKSGVNVKIIVPKYEDKTFINKATKSFYLDLLESGCEIYEYSLGFIHSKLFLSDDSIAVCGSINMDYRSLKLSYEVASVIYNTGEEIAIKQDLFDILKSSEKITIENCKNIPIYEKLYKYFAKIFSPIM